jgi:hypothetical protein
MNDLIEYRDNRDEKRLTMTVKEQVRKMIEKLPDECSIEDVHYQLYLIEKVRRGLKSIGDGKGIPHDQVRKQFATRASELFGRRRLWPT